MDEIDLAPAGELPEDAGTDPGEQASRQARRQPLPGRSESEPPPEEPGAGEWVPV